MICDLLSRVHFTLVSADLQTNISLAQRSSSRRNSCISRTRQRSRQSRRALSTFGSSRNEIVVERPVVLRRNIRPINKTNVTYRPMMLWRRTGGVLHMMCEFCLLKELQHFNIKWYCVDQYFIQVSSNQKRQSQQQAHTQMHKTGQKYGKIIMAKLTFKTEAKLLNKGQICKSLRYHFT